MINPDKDSEWFVPRYGDIKYIFGVLHQYDYSQALGRADWFQVPGQDIPASEAQ